MKCGNLFADVPAELPQEQFATILQSPHLRIERILSRGHTAPADPAAWFDQESDEWVALLEGEATLAFPDRPPIELHKGDWLLIPAHQRHRVTRTSSKETCIWLAVHITSAAGGSS